MSKAFEGFYTIFENGSWGGGTPYNPQALPIESESLGIRQEIRFRDNLISDGRTHNSQSLTPINQSPSGAISYSFRSDDCLKVFFSHFQYGTSDGGTKYTFYPSKGNPNFETGALGDGSYGGTGYVYSVSVLKRLTQSGTNAQLYKHGICDTLQISWASNSEAKLKADYKFRSVDSGTAWPSTPHSEISGSYSSEPTFHSTLGSISFEGGGIEVEQIDLTFKNNLEVSSRLGARDSEYFRFGRYEVSGELGFDLPQDGLKYVGSMLGTRAFSLTLEMRNSGTERVVYTLPNCVYTPFETNVDSDTYNLKLPFRAFGTGTLPPVQVDVYTRYKLVKIWDALSGVRTIGEFTAYDAGTGARTLSEYTQYNRDA